MKLPTLLIQNAQKNIKTFSTLDYFTFKKNNKIKQSKIKLITNLKKKVAVFKVKKLRKKYSFRKIFTKKKKKRYFFRKAKKKKKRIFKKKKNYFIIYLKKMFSLNFFYLFLILF